jgi:hypothetical protein
MAHSAKWNWLALLFSVGAFLVFQLVLDQFPKVFVNVPWHTSTAILAAVLFLAGAALLFVFRGGFWTQTALVTTIPVATQLIIQVGWGSDPAYPWLTALLAVPYAVLFFLGAVLLGGPLFLWRQGHGKSHLTPQSRADAR